MANRRRRSSWVFSAAGVQREERGEDYENRAGQIPSVIDTLRSRQSVAIEEEDAESAWAEYTCIPWSFWRDIGCTAAWPNVTFRWKEEELLRVRKVRRLDAKDNRKKCEWVNKPSFAPLWPSPDPITSHKEIWLAEGESDCGVLRFLGYDAYTLGSATVPVDTITVQYMLELGVEKVNVLYDGDTPGQEGGRKTAESLVAFGLEVRLLNILLVRRQYEKDISDILRYRGQLACREAMHELDENSEAIEDIRMDMILAGDEQIEWLWDRILPKGSLTLLSGPPKTMKTNLIYFMMKAAATGGKVLGRRFDHAKVLYCSEMPIAFDRARTRSILGPLDSRDHLYIRHEFGSVFAGKSWIERIAVIEQDIRRYECDLLIIDTASAWFGFSGEDENNATAIRSAFAPLRRIADRHNVTVLVVHHLGKGASSGPRGSSAWEAIPDVLLTQTLNSTQHIELSILGRVGGTSDKLTWSWPQEQPEPVVHSDTGSTDKPEGYGELEQLILETLKDYGTATTAEIVKEVGHDNRVVTRILKNLKERNIISQILTDDGKRKWSRFSVRIAEVD